LIPSREGEIRFRNRVFGFVGEQAIVDLKRYCRLGYIRSS
jgi:hypothetical protein